MIGNCPKCGQPVARVAVADVIAQPLGADPLNAISFCCQNCQAVLGIQIDPIAIRTGIVAQILEALGR